MHIKQRLNLVSAGRVGICSYFGSLIQVAGPHKNKFLREQYAIRFGSGFALELT